MLQLPDIRPELQRLGMEHIEGSLTGGSFVEQREWWSPKPHQGTDSWCVALPTPERPNWLVVFWDNRLRENESSQGPHIKMHHAYISDPEAMRVLLVGYALTGEFDIP